MRNIVISLLAVSLISGCTTTPSSPKPHKTKYTFQCLQVISPDALVQELTFDANENEVILNESIEMQTVNPFQEQKTVSPDQVVSSRPLTHPQVEELLKSSGVETVEFPLVYAAVGESVTNEQTRVVDMAMDANIVDGQVVYKKKPYKLGKQVSVTVKRADGTNVTYHIHMKNQELAGFEEYKAKNGSVVEMPFFNSRSVRSEITQPTYMWTSFGGGAHKVNDGPITHDMIFVRVLPPATEK